MDDTKDEIIKTLQHIKAKPGCDSVDSKLNGNTVKMLHDEGFVSGHDVTPISAKSPQFIELRVSLAGHEYLLKLEADKEPKKPPTPHWYSNPFVSAFLGAFFLFIAWMIKDWLNITF